MLQSAHACRRPCLPPTRRRTAPAFSPLYQQIKALMTREPAGRRVEARARPSRARSSWRRASRSARARCARRSTNSPPRTCWCAARARAPSSPPTPSSTTQYRFLRLMPDDGARARRHAAPLHRLPPPARAGRRGARARPARRRRGGAGPARAARCAARRWCSTTSGCPAALFKGLTAERLADYRGPMYGLFEAEFGVRMIRAEEKIRAVAAATPRRPSCSAWRRARRCCASSGCPSPTATGRSSCAAACTTPRRTTIATN